MEITIENLKKVHREIEELELEQREKGRLKTHQVLRLGNLKEERNKLINSL